MDQDTKTETNLVHPEDSPHPENSETPFFPVSEGKLITLYILSFGLYGVYWFYKNWKRQEPFMDKKIYPVWRAVFSIFFTHSLFRRIDEKASHLPQEHKFNANVLATSFVAAVIISNVLDHNTSNTTTMVMSTTSYVTVSISLILFLFSTYPLAKAQATVNRINNDLLGYLNHKYTIWNYALIILGAIAWFLIIIMMLFETAGLGIPQ